jgi:hypothetical protein
MHSKSLWLAHMSEAAAKDVPDKAVPSPACDLSNRASVESQLFAGSAIPPLLPRKSERAMDQPNRELPRDALSWS